MELKKRILIVEDEPLIIKAIKDAFQRNNEFDIMEANEGGKAFAIIQEFHPDLALVDIDIPNMDGVTLAKEVAAKNLDKQTKIMFLTNAGDLSTISSATEIPGVLGYFYKAEWDINDVIQEVSKKIKEISEEKKREEARTNFLQKQKAIAGAQKE